MNSKFLVAAPFDQKLSAKRRTQYSRSELRFKFRRSVLPLATARQEFTEEHEEGTELTRVVGGAQGA